jgi:phage terminase large subunit-like protein
MVLFGAIDIDTGLRRIRKSNISFGRKNGKTTMVACLALYLLLADGERGGEIVVAANDKDQAGILFRAAASMVAEHPALAARCRVVPTRKEIHDRKSGSVLKAVSCDVPGKLGMDLSAWIYDELAFAPKRDLYDVLDTSGGSRRQPLGIVITTASWNMQGVGYEEYQYACRVRDGVIDDPSYLPVIYETLEPNPDAGEDGHDWTDESTWKLANPALGDFRSLEELRDRVEKAKDIPARQVAVKVLYLNRWLQSSAARFIDYQRWEACRVLDIGDLAGRPAYGGLDLSSTTDLSAFVLAVPMEDGRIALVPKIYIPGDDLHQRGERDGVSYETWAEAGHLTVTPGPVVDYSVIESDIKAAGERYDLRAVAFDRWNSSSLVQGLMGAGLQMVAMGQGFQSMSAPTKALQSLVLGKGIVHPGNSVLDWNISNLIVTQDDADNVKPSKDKSSHRIDGAVASIMAVDMAQRNAKPAATESVYEKRGLRSI